MFGFEKKEEKGKGLELKVVFDMELLDKAFEAAIDEYKTCSYPAAVMAGASEDEAKMLRELDCIRMKCFAINVKRLITELSEKE